LAWWKIDDAEHQLSHEISGIVVLGDLRARVLHAKDRTKVDAQLVGGLSSLREGVCRHHAPHADIDLGKVVIGDLVHK